jgi:myosin protein heavy chain
MKQLDEAKKAQKAANAEINSLQTQIAALVAQINGGNMTRTKSGGGTRKPIKDPKRREELVIVRDPRNGSGL